MVQPRPVSRRKPTTRGEENQAIREAILNAVSLERKNAPFILVGRGHEPRLTLDQSLAAVLRGVRIPCFQTSGYGANQHYPARVFRRAQRMLRQTLGWSPIGTSAFFGVLKAWRQSKPVPPNAAHRSLKGNSGSGVLLITLPDRSVVACDTRTFRFTSASCSLPSDSSAPPAITRGGVDLLVTKAIPHITSALKRPSLPFAECFRRVAAERYSPRCSFHDFDFMSVARFYKLPGRYQGGTFSSSFTEWDFLDGGISQQHGYGSTGSWTVIRGFEALRVTCLLCGIRQPCRLSGETSCRPLAVLLEELNRFPLHETLGP